jgi:flagellar hook assembly protein FlgD
VFYRVSTVDFAGNESEAVAPGTLSDAGEVPRGTVLRQNRPNPFNPSTVISFELATAGEVRLAVYDSRGAVVRELVSGPRPAGAHEVRWDGRDVRGRPAGSGVYYARLQFAEEPAHIVRMSLVR